MTVASTLPHDFTLVSHTQVSAMQTSDMNDSHSVIARLYSLIARRSPQRGSAHKRWVGHICMTLALLPVPLIAETDWPDDEMLYRLRESLMKVNTTTRSGGHGFGTAVAITPEKAVTNCHVLANANGVSITKWGSEHAVDAIQSDWKHDLCILTVKYASMQPATLGDSRSLQYEQRLISISMPSDSPAPYTAMTQVRALYTMDDEAVIRSQTAFAIGASGSPVFDLDGKLVAISTFKSPGKKAYFYNMPVNWVKALLAQPEQALGQNHDAPFWDAEEIKQPFFMRVVLPYQYARWPTVLEIASEWVTAEPGNVEAHYYRGEAYFHLGQLTEASAAYQQCQTLFGGHPASLAKLWLLASRAGDQSGAQQFRLALQRAAPAYVSEVLEQYPELDHNKD